MINELKFIGVKIGSDMWRWCQIKINNLAFGELMAVFMHYVQHEY